MSKNLEIAYLLDFYGSLLNDTQREAMEYYYNDDLSLAEVAALLKISRQGVRAALKKAEALLTEYESKMGLKKRFACIRGDLETIRTAAIHIQTHTPDTNIAAKAEEIIKTADAMEI